MDEVKTIRQCYETVESMNCGLRVRDAHKPYVGETKSTFSLVSIAPKIHTFYLISTESYYLYKREVLKRCRIFASNWMEKLRNISIFTVFFFKIIGRIRKLISFFEHSNLLSYFQYFLIFSINRDRDRARAIDPSIFIIYKLNFIIGSNTRIFRSSLCGTSY